MKILKFEDFVIETMVNQNSLNQLKKASSGTSNSQGTTNLVSKGVETREDYEKSSKPKKSKKIKKSYKTTLK